MAISLISPGVKITEQDLVSSTPSLATTSGGFSGQFRWGPIDESTLVNNEADLVENFGKPNATNVVDFLCAANFLGYTSPLYVVRVANTALNSTAENTTGGGGVGTGLLIKNSTVYTETYQTGSGNVGPWAARYAGALGNSLKVSTCPSSTAFSQTLSGNVAIAVGSTTVVGTATDFANNVTVGDVLVVNNRAIKVSAVTNATFLTLESAHLTGATAGSEAVRRWEFHSEFSGAPGTSTDATNHGASGDELHVVVVDEDGQISGVPGTVLEKFEGMSKGSDAKAENGGSNYYRDVINEQSEYIWWMDHDNAGTNWGNTLLSAVTFTSVTAPKNYSLAGGSDGNALTNGDKIAGYALLANKSEVPISIVVGGQADATVTNTLTADLGESRKDCVVCASPSRASVVNNAGSELSDIESYISGLTRSTYLVVDSGWKYQYDRYNDVYVYVPLNADTAGIMARNDTNRDPWLSPAGYVNGQVQNLVKLAYNPTLADRDILYKAAVNPVITTTGRGTVLFGDKTFSLKNTSLNRINVRRLFITLEQTIGEVADNILFEQNDAATRSNFVNLVTPYLRQVQARRGITAFRVVCDVSNNPESVVNANEFVCDIFVQPVRSINFIQLNFVSVRGTATFTEIAA